MAGAKSAVFTITTPRSGTQWLAESLRALYPDDLHIAHEPVVFEYNPRVNFRSRSACTALREVGPVREHLTSIHDVLKAKTYVEIGYSSYCAIPLFAQEFRGQVNVVQLVRDPVRVAASLLTHDWYTPKRKRPEIEYNMALLPTDPGAQFPGYQAKWQQMTSFERALYYWLEIHQYGLEIEQTSQLPFLRVRFEDLLTSRTERQRLTDFLGVSEAAGWDHLTPQVIDSYQGKTRAPIDPSLIRRHPEIMSLAKRLGYDPSQGRRSTLIKRYRMSVRDFAREAKRRLFRALRGKERCDGQMPRT